MNKKYMLTNWYAQVLPSGKTCVFGTVFGNPNFTDGTEIKTSYIKKVIDKGEEIIVCTRNSIYRLLGDPHVNYENARDLLHPFITPQIHNTEE